VCGGSSSLGGGTLWGTKTQSFTRTRGISGGQPFYLPEIEPGKRSQHHGRGVRGRVPQTGVYWKNEKARKQKGEKISS